MKRTLSFVLVLCFVSGVAFAQKVMVIKAAHSMPTTYHYHDGMIKFAEEVAKRSNGTMKIEIYPAAQLGEERVTMEQCKIGAIPIVLTGISDSYAPRTGVFGLPFLFRDSDHANKVLNGPIGQEVYKDLEANNLRLLSVWENGFRQISNSKRPINKVDDLVGLKIRTPESPVWIDTIKAFGAIPTPMPFAETATAIIQGLVDGQENAILHMLANKTYEIQKYIAIVNYMYGPAPLLACKTWFDKLTAEQQKILLESASIANTYMRSVAAKNEASALEIFKKAGNIITTPSPDSFKAKVEPLYSTTFAEKYGKDLIDRIRNVK